MGVDRVEEYFLRLLEELREEGRRGKRNEVLGRHLAPYLRLCRLRLLGCKRVMVVVLRLSKV